MIHLHPFDSLTPFSDSLLSVSLSLILLNLMSNDLRKRRNEKENGNEEEIDPHVRIINIINDLENES